MGDRKYNVIKELVGVDGEKEGQRTLQGFLGFYALGR